VFDCIRNEAAGGITRKARVRRRQDGDAHQLSTRKTA
jgi:hypothetical protein